MINYHEQKSIENNECTKFYIICYYIIIISENRHNPATKYESIQPKTKNLNHIII